MRTAHKTLGAIWMAICAYFFANLTEGLYRAHPNRLGTLTINVFFILLFLAGAIAGFYLLIGARWPRVALIIVTLLTVTASVMGLFAFFNADPFSVAGIAFDLFALASAGVLFFAPPRKE